MNSLVLLFGLVMASLLIAIAAKRLDLPYPIALVAGGILGGLIPGVPRVILDPNIVFFLLLPPILGEAAYFTSWRDFSRLRRPILMLAFGLVIATSAVVAAICVWLIPGMTWASGFVLGAIVSPPDAAAATAITRGLRLPKRIVQIIEGESLVNDAAGLTVYRFAVAAVMTGVVAWGQVTLSFVWIVVGGVGIGFAVGWIYIRLYPMIRDPESEILSTFLFSFANYIVAELAHASGVLAVVTGGLVLGWHAPQLLSANTRIRGTAVWQTVIFLVNALIFILIGLQIPKIWQSLSGYSTQMLLLWSAAVTLGAVLIRILWVFVGAYLPRWCSSRIRFVLRDPGWRPVLVTGWIGLRGVVSLAAALALPENFPNRDLISLLTCAVIVGTLGLQGLTLRPLIQALKLPKDNCSEEEQLEARIYSTERALLRMVELEDTASAPPNVLARVRSFFEDQLTDLRARLQLTTQTDDVSLPEQFQTVAEQRIWWELARTEREAILQLRREQKIGDDALHEIQRDIDLLETRIVPH